MENNSNNSNNSIILNISKFLNKIIPDLPNISVSSARKDIAHGINIQTIAVMAGMLTMYLHLKKLSKTNKDLANFLRIDLIIMMGIILITHIAPDIIANFDDKLIENKTIEYSIFSSITILTIEVIIATILLLPLFLIKNTENAIIVIYIIAFLLLIFNNLFVLQNDLITTTWHILLDISVVTGVFLISKFFNDTLIRKHRQK